MLCQCQYVYWIFYKCYKNPVRKKKNFRCKCLQSHKQHAFILSMLYSFSLTTGSLHYTQIYYPLNYYCIVTFESSHVLTMEILIYIHI